MWIFGVQSARAAEHLAHVGLWAFGQSVRWSGHDVWRVAFSSVKSERTQSYGIARWAKRLLLYDLCMLLSCLKSANVVRESVAFHGFLMFWNEPCQDDPDFKLGLYPKASLTFSMFEVIKCDCPTELWTCAFWAVLLPAICESTAPLWVVRGRQDILQTLYTMTCFVFKRKCFVVLMSNLPPAQLIEFQMERKRSFFAFVHWRHQMQTIADHLVNCLKNPFRFCTCVSRTVAHRNCLACIPAFSCSPKPHERWSTTKCH